MSLTVAILGLAFLVFVHEAGHFFVARAVGMRPRKFYVGFPPALAKVTRNGIEYGIGTIPLGGYVKIPGMHRPAPSDVDVHLGRAAAESEAVGARTERLKELLAAGEMDPARAALPALGRELSAAELSPPAERSGRRGLRELGDGLGADAYWRQRTWKKIAVIFAGPATNLVLAVALFTALLMQGGWQMGVRLQADAAAGTATTTIEDVLPDSPAAGAGLRAGDRIVAVDSRRVTTEELLDTIRGSEGRPLDVTVVRDGSTVVVPDVRARRVGGRSLLDATGRALEITGIVTREVAGFFPRLVQGEGRKDVSSPVGIADASSKAFDKGLSDFLFVLGLISLSLALLNLLPLLPLDGGHIVFSIVEGIRRRSLGREVYERVSMIGIALVLFLFAIGLSNDIGRLNGG